MIKPLHTESIRLEPNNLHKTLRGMDFFSQEALKRALLLEVAGRLRLDGGILANAAEGLELHSPGWTLPYDVLLEAAAGPPPDGGQELLASPEDRELTAMITGEPPYPKTCSTKLRFIGLDDAEPWKPDATLLATLTRHGVELAGASIRYLLHDSNSYETRIKDPSHV